ncbi:unnamed protein product [Ilex paraguariensis]|uniref:Rho-GAP domain-containing protein n=1 Tax=Ilex paraguariensis TaxID=185542 RepID=A0ABC8UN08_9AQUA
MEKSLNLESTPVVKYEENLYSSKSGKTLTFHHAVISKSNYSTSSINIELVFLQAWFRELPNGVLDSLSPELVMQAQSEEECAQLVQLLPPTETGLLDWAINLMADVAQLEHLNKMNARNVAMVFAPNMTQMSDPLTALMYAVQVMNFLKTLIVKTLRKREDSTVEPGPIYQLEPLDEIGQHSSLQPLTERRDEVKEDEEAFVAKEPLSESPAHPTHGHSKTDTETHGFLTSIENIIPGEKGKPVDNCAGEVSNEVDAMKDGLEGRAIMGSGGAQLRIRRIKTGQSSTINLRKGSRKLHEHLVVRVAGHVEKSKETSSITTYQPTKPSLTCSITSRLNSRT